MPVGQFSVGSCLPAQRTDQRQASCTWQVSLAEFCVYLRPPPPRNPPPPKPPPKPPPPPKRPPKPPPLKPPPPPKRSPPPKPPRPAEREASLKPPKRSSPALRACDSRSAHEVSPDAAPHPPAECCCQPPLPSLRITLPLLSATWSLLPGLRGAPGVGLAGLGVVGRRLRGVCGALRARGRRRRAVDRTATRACERRVRPVRALARVGVDVAAARDVARPAGRRIDGAVVAARGVAGQALYCLPAA